jgi:O-antigen/teichoic acid export membrane protein
MYLAIREMVGIGVRLGGVLVLTLVLGPSKYGVYVTAAGVISVMASIAQLGAEVYLVRFADEPDEDTYHQVATVLAVWTFFVMLIGLGVAQALTFVLPDHSFLNPLRVLVLILPINVLWAPAQARIERAFRYKAIGMLELAGDTTLYVVSLSLAIAGAGVWAPTAGYVAWQALLLVGSWRLARLRPRWRWNRVEAKKLLRFGRTYATSNLLGQALNLVNPLVVGRYLGPAVVGQIALALRLVDTFNFVGRAVWRLSLVVFGQVSKDLRRLERVLGQVMSVQVMLLAPLYAAFVFIAPSIVGPVFGARWALAIEVFPFLATRALVNSMSTALDTAAFTIDRTGIVVRATIVALTAQVVTAMILVPRIGPDGYGYSELAQTVGILTLALELSGTLRINYRQTVPWLFAAIPLLFVRRVDWWWLCIVPVLLLPFLKTARTQVREGAQMVRHEVMNRRGGKPGGRPSPDPRAEAREMASG